MTSEMAMVTVIMDNGMMIVVVIVIVVIEVVVDDKTRVAEHNTPPLYSSCAQ